jgi:DNA-directed RNA polymerase specialized sigma subunit
VAAFLFNTVQNLCRSFPNRPVDCPTVREVMLDQILAPEVREGKTVELLLAELGALPGEDLERARSVFRLRYARYQGVGDVSKEMGLTESEVSRYERFALQLLHLVLVP